MKTSMFADLCNKTEYPAFYESHIQHIVDTYNIAKITSDDAVGFIFITDVHIHLNGRASVPLILEIGRRTGVKTVLCGGDHCWAYGSKAQCIADFEDSLNYLDPIRDAMQLHHARGNHDCTVRSSSELATGYTMPYERVQRALRMHASAANGEVQGKLYFYVDDNDAKVRYVVLDTSEYQLEENLPWGVQNGMSDKQLKWLAESALTLPGAQWTAVVMGHIPCDPGMPGCSPELEDLRMILEAFKHKTNCSYRNFQNAAGELAAYICGHNHKDAHVVSNGVLHISTGCDAYCKDDKYTRDVGCVENTLFDLFLLDKEKRTLRTFRVGAGADRVFSY